MFSKSRESEPATGPAAAPAKPRNTVPARSKAAAPAIVSSDVTITGDIISSGDVQIDGKVKGNTRGASITVGETANLEGEVVANEVIVRGHILGTLRANRVQLCKTAHVEGDILHEALIVETGAFFEGNCRHSSDPMNGAGAQRKAQPPVGDSAILNAKPTEQPDARSPKAIGLR